MFGTVTNCMNEEDLIGGCLTLLKGMVNVVVFSSTSYQGKKYTPDRSEQIAKKLGAVVLHVDTNDQAEMRNAGLTYLRGKGIKYAFIVDVDEWWTNAALEQAREFVLANPDESYTKKMLNMFRRPNWFVESPGDRGTVVVIRTDKQMVKPRTTDAHVRALEIPGNVYHFSYVRTPDKILEKITNFSHASEVTPGWFNDVFLKCTLETPNVHPTVGNAWPTIREVELPQEINDLMPKHLWSA